MIALGVGALGACVGDAREPTDPQVGSDSHALSHALCGGIAGLSCPDGQKCLLEGDYPDASGVCVGPPELHGWKSKCKLVLCAAVECPLGQHRQFTPGRCCGICVPDGPPAPADGGCKTAQDCEGLIHIMCVGQWSCNAGECEYNCTTSTL